MPATTNSKLPFPAATDPADVPVDLQKLAAALDEIAYAQITVGVATAVTTEAGAAVAVAAPAVTFDGATAVIIEFFSPRVQKGATVCFIDLFDGSTPQGLWATQAGDSPVLLRRRLTPAAGSHTYSARFHVDGGNGTVVAGTGGAGANMPAYIRISRA